MDRYAGQSVLSDGDIACDSPDIVINKWNNGTYEIPVHDVGTSIIVGKRYPFLTILNPASV